MSDKTELKARVLRNELAIIIGCQDGRSAKEKAEDVIAWMDRNDSRATIQPAAAPVGEADPMPGASGFTMACFKADDVPVGAKLYTGPVAPADAVRDARDLALEEAARLCESLIEKHQIHSNFICANAIRDLKSTPKEPAK